MFGHRIDADGGQQRSRALEDFRAARRRAALHAIMGRLQGTSLNLLSFNEVAHQLQVIGQVDRGVRQIPLDRIVGSVGRYDEFDRSFLPLKSYDADRWASVRAAAADPAELPPIEVYQIEDVYFVIDGNHRVSIARHLGLDFLDAHIIETRTRAPLPSDLDLEKLILASEQAAFLAQTRLDQHRPDADLRVTLPGNYAKLENHIEVHRFFVEMKQERELTDEEAVLGWYDDAYMPAVEAIREHGLLRGFPGRTETDLYLWIAENQAELRNELGWRVEPESAAAQASPGIAETDLQGLKGVYRRVLRAVLPQQEMDKSPWSQAKAMDRYSDRLFATILAAADIELGGAALGQAVQIARREKAHLLAIHSSSRQEQAEEMARMRARFAALLGGAGLTGELAFQSGIPLAGLLQWAPLADLLAVDAQRLRETPNNRRGAKKLVEACPRPLLIATPNRPPFERVILLCDDGREMRESLFVVAYLAEMWGCQVTLLGEASPGVEEALAYLSIHEIAAERASVGGRSPKALFDAATAENADLLVAGGHEKRAMDKFALANQLFGDLHAVSFSLLVCP